MKKFFTFFSLLLIFALGVKAQTTTWDFTASNPSWTSGTIGGTDPVVDYVDTKGLGLHGIATNTNFAAWNTTSAASWSAPNDPYAAATVRVQTNGAGFAATGVEATPTQRYFFIQVDQPCTVKVWFKSGSTNVIRSVIASDGTTEYGKAASVGSPATLTGYPNDGGFLSTSITKAGTFYLYGDASVNIYQIQVVGATVSLAPANPLPVTFSGINANYNSGIVKISWSNATELNTSAYSIERSIDGKNFTSIGTVKAINSRLYSWYDNSPSAGNNFYRIKGIDINGSITYSTVVRISSSNKVPEIVVAPNPVRDRNLTLQLNNLAKGSYTLNIFNSTSQKVFSSTVAHGGGNSVQTLSLPASVTKGLYNVHVTNGTASFTKSIIVE